MDKKVLTQRLDRLVSVLVRLRENRCATCGKKLSWRYRQAGHFVPRVVQQTRWDFFNVHVQCAHCNVELGGNIEKYKQFIADNYGIITFARLTAAHEEYKQGRGKSFTEDEMRDLYNNLLAIARMAEEEEVMTLIPKDWKPDPC